jgi:hypothetical protein
MGSDDRALDRVRARAGRVVSFSDEESAGGYALAENLTLAPEEDFRLHDLDGAVSWLEPMPGLTAASCLRAPPAKAMLIAARMSSSAMSLTRNPLAPAASFP